MSKKVTLDRAQFLASKPIVLNICGQPVEAKPREFSTGSLGYYASAKVTTVIDGQVCKLQVSANLPICGTKPEDGNVGE